MNIRLPVERHRRLRRMAFDMEVSMNDIINDALEAHLAQLEDDEHAEYRDEELSP